MYANTPWSTAMRYVRVGRRMSAQINRMTREAPPRTCGPCGPADQAASASIPLRVSRDVLDRELRQFVLREEDSPDVFPYCADGHELNAAQEEDRDNERRVT